MATCWPQAAGAPSPGAISRMRSVVPLGNTLVLYSSRLGSVLALKCVAAFCSDSPILLLPPLCRLLKKAISTKPMMIQLIQDDEGSGPRFFLRKNIGGAKVRY